MMAKLPRGIMMMCFCGKKQGGKVSLSLPLQVDFAGNEEPLYHHQHQGFTISCGIKLHN